MMDLDQFKAINDTHGHPTGDRVLRAAARTIAEGLRATDPDRRYGGDEFLILLPGTTAADAAAIADQLRSRLLKTQITPLGSPIGASLGVAVLGPRGTGPEPFWPAPDLAAASRLSGPGAARSQSVRPAPC